MKLSISNPSIKTTARMWWPFFVTITLVSLIIFTVVQQSVRQTADDPQVEFSEQLADQLKDINDPTSFFNTQAPTDIRKSLGVFAIAYSDDFKAVAATGRLDGAIPTVPKGVLEQARDHDENRITWQPADGVRIASVIRSYVNQGKTKYVLVGRSLREVEDREVKLLEVTAAGWAASSIALFFILGMPHLVAVRRVRRASSPAASAAKAAPRRTTSTRKKPAASRSKKR